MSEEKFYITDAPTSGINFNHSLWNCPKHGELNFVGLTIKTPDKEYNFCHICWAESMVKGGVNELTRVDSKKDSDNAS